MSDRDDERERPKKSWRERDAQRGKSVHVSSDRRENPRTAERSKMQRAALDRAFRDGLIGKLVKEREKGDAPQAESDSPERSELLKKIRTSESRAEVNAAIDELLASGDYPDDWDVLVRSLDHGKDRVILGALRHIERLLEHESPPRKAVLLQRLGGLADTSFDDDIRELAATLRDQLS